MKILWISEMKYKGTISEDHNNLKSDVALVCSIKAEHQPMFRTKSWTEDIFEDYDFVMFNNTQKLYSHPYLINMFDKIKKHCKIGFFQEGPINDWQDWEVKEQALLLRTMKKIDAYFCSNKRDIPYFKEHVNDKAMVFWQKSPINLEKVQKNILTKEERQGIMLGGSICCKWYNGMTSLKIADSITTPILIPKMGKTQDYEPFYYSSFSKNKCYMVLYFNFDKWIEVLSHLKYGIHMMPSVAAGSFHVNCSALGIPCIGNSDIDTQKIMFPDLSLHPYRQIKEGKELLKRLSKDDSFYDEVTKKALEKVKEWDLKIVGKQLEKDIKKVLER